MSVPIYYNRFVRKWLSHKVYNQLKKLMGKKKLVRKMIAVLR